MVMWVFGYGSLIWKAGFEYDEKLVGFINGYRRVFYQGSTDHRGTPSFPGRTVTLEPHQGDICWGVAYKISGEENEQIALTYLEVREKQYDTKAYLDFFTDPESTTPTIQDVMVYVASPDTRVNPNYLGPAPLEEMAKQIVEAEGPSGPNRDYLFQLEEALDKFGRLLCFLHFITKYRNSYAIHFGSVGCKDRHVKNLADAVRKILSEMVPCS